MVKWKQTWSTLASVVIELVIFQTWSTLAPVVIELVIFKDGIFLQASWFSQKNVVVWMVEEGQKVEEGDMGYKDGKLVVVLVVVMVYMDD